MKTFSPSEAALEGFRLTRERPGTILVWGGVYFLGVMAMALVMVIGIGPQFLSFLKGRGLESGEMDAFANLALQSWPFFLIALLIAIVMLAVITAGIYRLVLRPQEPGFAHLRLGVDEFRLAALNLALLSIGVVFLILLDVVLQLVLTGQPQGGLMSFLGSCLVLGLMIWIGVRLSLATPMTFDRRRISIRDAWRLTRGHFWGLLGAVVLALIFYLMIWVLVSIIGYAIVTLAGGQEALSDPAHLAPGQVVALILTLVIQLLLPILQFVTLYAPLAVAYKALAHDAADEAGVAVSPA
jgi:hypothetical protein